LGKVLKTIVVVAVAFAVAYYAPQLSATLLSALGTQTATALATAAMTAAVTTAMTVGATMAMKALGLMPVPGVPSSRNGTPGMFRQSISESFIVYGRRRVGGMLAFFHARKISGDGHYRYFVIAVAGHRCAGNVSFMLNDESVTVDGSGLVGTGKYQDAAWLWFQRGEEAETANATFVAECGGRWTVNHKGNGIAAIYAKFKMTDDVVEAGMPNISAIIDGKDDILDPRDDDEKFTNNGILVFYDWMKMPREEGGFGAWPEEIPDDDWISAQANICDETPDIDDGPRYALDGVIVTGAPPEEIRTVLTVNCAGTFAYSGGKFWMRPGYYVPPTLTLSEDDLNGPIRVDPFLPGDQAANEVHGTYVDPGKYQGVPFNTQRVLPAPTDIRQMDTDFAFITSRYRAERVGAIMLNRAQAEKTVTWPMNIVGIKTEAMDTVMLGTERYGLSNYAWTVTGWSMTSDYSVVLQLREESPEIYDPPETSEPEAAPAIAVAEEVIPRTENSMRILNSFVTDADPADGLIQGTDTQLTVENHTRTYPDKTVPVTGAVITTLNDGTTPIASNVKYHIYYDDEDRLGGAVTYQVTTVSQDATNTPDNPHRHYVGSLPTDVPGGSGTSGGGSSPPGWDGDDYHEP
jgi:hypothetical protein